MSQPTNEERRDDAFDYDYEYRLLPWYTCECGMISLCPRRQGKACPMADEGDEDE